MSKGETMNEEPPKIIAICHDDYHAKTVGTTPDGRQFFLTYPFVPLGHDFVALYLFDEEGQLLEAKIEDLGPRDSIDQERFEDMLKLRLRELGEVTFGDISVAPFSVERFGIEFGLIAEGPEDPEDEEAHWWVTVQPGDYMAFYPPWDGDYDT